MRNLLLSVALIAAPVAVFAAGYAVLVPAAAPSAGTAAPSAVADPLGDLAPYATIVADVQTIAATGDLAAAQVRITDLETAWDDAESTMRPMDKAAWGNVDGTIDDALNALRASTPDATTIETSLTDLQTALAAPTPASGTGSAAIQTVSGIAVTDESGRWVPCETMLGTFKTTLATATLADADKAAVADFQSKGTERCNADDDKRADDFFAQGLALMAN